MAHEDDDLFDLVARITSPILRPSNNGFGQVRSRPRPRLLQALRMRHGQPLQSFGGFQPFGGFKPFALPQVGIPQPREAPIQFGEDRVSLPQPREPKLPFGGQVSIPPPPKARFPFGGGK